MQALQQDMKSSSNLIVAGHQREVVTKRDFKLPSKPLILISFLEGNFHRSGYGVTDAVAEWTPVAVAANHMQ
jgi:hypothetical protein